MSRLLSAGGGMGCGMRLQADIGGVGQGRAAIGQGGGLGGEGGNRGDLERDAGASRGIKVGVCAGWCVCGLVRLLLARWGGQTQHVGNCGRHYV